MYRPGDALSVTLTALPALPGWTIRANALILAIDDAELLLYLHDHDQDGAGMYAAGSPFTGPNGDAIAHPITTGPAVGLLHLGPVTDHEHTPDRLATLAATARDALAIHRTERGNGPLTAADLPVLDLACDDLAVQRAATAAALNRRDRIVLRFLDGGLLGTELERPGLSRPQISTIKRRAERPA